MVTLTRIFERYHLILFPDGNGNVVEHSPTKIQKSSQFRPPPSVLLELIENATIKSFIYLFRDIWKEELSPLPWGVSFGQINIKKGFNNVCGGHREVRTMVVVAGALISLMLCHLTQIPRLGHSWTSDCIPRMSRSNGPGYSSDFTCSGLEDVRHMEILITEFSRI